MLSQTVSIRIAFIKVRFEKIKVGAFVLIENKKETISPTWQNLRLIADNSIPKTVLNSLCELRHERYR